MNLWRDITGLVSLSDSLVKMFVAVFSNVGEKIGEIEQWYMFVNGRIEWKGKGEDPR